MQLAGLGEDDGRRVAHEHLSSGRACCKWFQIQSDVACVFLWGILFNTLFIPVHDTHMFGAPMFQLDIVNVVSINNVRENERLNKQLKLFSERSPNSSLDLISARLGLKFRLGTAGLRHEEMETSKPRNWTRVRPMAAKVLDSCLDNWMDGLSDVLSQAERFQEPGLPGWCPSKETVHSWMPVLQPAPLSGNANTRVLSGLVNRKLYQFVQGKNAQIGNPSEFPEPYFSAITIIEADQLKPGRPFRLPNGSRHCWMQEAGSWVRWSGAIAGRHVVRCHCWMLGAIAGCHIMVGCHCWIWMPIACHCWVSLLDAIGGGGFDTL